MHGSGLGFLEFRVSFTRNECKTGTEENRDRYRSSVLL